MCRLYVIVAVVAVCCVVDHSTKFCPQRSEKNKKQLPRIKEKT